MKTAGDIIDALGGYRRLATAMGLPPGTVGAWKARGSIPARHWGKLLDEIRRAHLADVTLETLAVLRDAGTSRARWQAEHADVIDWYNKHIERDGVFGDDWRTF